MTGATSKRAARIFAFAAILLFIQVGIIAITSLSEVAMLITGILGVMLMIAAYGAATGVTYATYRDSGYGTQTYAGEMEVGAYCGFLGPLTLIIAMVQVFPVYLDYGFVAIIPYVPGVVAGIIGTIGLLVYLRDMRLFYKFRPRRH